MARQFASALESAEQTISLAPGMIWLYSNRAHALMFLGRSDEARALYLQYRRKAGLTHPLMDEIEKRFTAGG
jgi:hypothetical protein